MPARAPTAPVLAPAPAPALGILESQSIARGIVCADAMLKKAPVRLLASHPVSPGKHVVIVAGEVAEVDEAMSAGTAAAGHLLIDRLFLPYAHEQLAPLIRGERPPGDLDAVGVIETFTVVSAVLAADAAAKAADVHLLEMQLARGLGGKAFFTLTGELTAVQAAVAAAVAVIEPALLVLTEIIPAPHEDLRRGLIF
ncbi:MAG TPA: BMC domain-containing protein [Polyangia bacterium]